MKTRIISRIVSALVLGILFGLSIHFDDLKWQQKGREEFLKEQASRFDRLFFKPKPIAPWLFVGVSTAVFVFGVYELIAFGISKTVKKGGINANNREINGSGVGNA